MIDLTKWDIILLNTSGGKDSQVMLDLMVQAAINQGVSDRLVAVHADLGRVEWSGTRELAETQAKHYGLRFEVVKRTQNDLLEHIESRGKFPGGGSRFCTSDHKRGPIQVLMTSLVREFGRTRKDAPVRILNCMGLRAQESTKRADKAFFSRDKKASNGKRTVFNYLPIHKWSEVEVWSRIKSAGVPYHRAYDLGMPRLSCVFCVFASRNALLVAGVNNPELLQQYVDVEKRINHTFQPKLSLVSIQAAIASGERAQGPITWSQCA